MIFAKEKTLIPIPNTIDNRKLALIPRQKAAIWPLKSRRKLAVLILFMELINSSYIPTIKAIVPPETPGTTSAAPMPMPFNTNRLYALIPRFAAIVW